MVDKVSQQIHLCLGQVVSVVADGQLEAEEVDRDVPERKTLVGGCLVALTTAFQQVADAAEQFRQGKRLGHVLIGARIEGLGLVLAERAGTENQYGQVNVVFADLSADLVSAHAR